MWNYISSYFNWPHCFVLFFAGVIFHSYRQYRHYNTLHTLYWLFSITIYIKIYIYVEFIQISQIISYEMGRAPGNITSLYICLKVGIKWKIYHTIVTTRQFSLPCKYLKGSENGRVFAGQREWPSSYDWTLYRSIKKDVGCKQSVRY